MSVLQSCSSIGSPSHCPLFSHSDSGTPSGQLQGLSRDIFPPPQVALHSDQQVHSPNSHFGGQASTEHGVCSVKAPGQPSSISGTESHVRRGESGASNDFGRSLQVLSRGCVPPPHVDVQGALGSDQGDHSHKDSPLQLKHSFKSPHPQSGLSSSPPGGQEQSRSRNF